MGLAAGASARRGIGEGACILRGRMRVVAGRAARGARRAANVRGALCTEGRDAEFA